jgi:signal transduction histidine kinase
MKFLATARTNTTLQALLLALGLLVLAGILQGLFSEDRNARAAQKKEQQYFQQQLREAQNLLSLWQAKPEDATSQSGLTDFNLLISQGDSLLFWQHNRSALADTLGSQVHLEVSGEQRAWILIPSPTLEDASTKSSGQLLLLLAVYLLLFLSLASLLHQLAVQIARRWHPGWGIVFLGSSVTLLRYLSQYYELLAEFQVLPLFSKALITPVLNNTLGDLLINCVLLLWFMLFLHREFPIKGLGQLPNHLKPLVSTLNYLAIVVGVQVIVQVFRNLVLQSEIPFDFDHVLNMSPYSLLAVCCVLLLLITLFLFSHRIVLSIFSIGMSLYARFASFGVALLLSIPLFYLFNPGIPLPQLLLGLIAFVSLLDLFVDTGRANLVWLIGWLLIFAGLSSLLLFKYNGDKALLQGMEETGSLIKPISLFSLLFILMLLAIPPLSWLNRRLKALPPELDFTGSNRPSLSRRIQRWVIGLTLFTFLAIGVITVWNFRQSAELESQQQLRSKIETLLADMARDSLGAHINWPAYVQEQAAVHQLEFGVFQADGSLLGSSEPNLYRQGLLAPRMDYRAWKALKEPKPGLVVVPERLGSQAHLSVYTRAPVNGYSLRVPFYRERERMRSEVADFIGTLLNVYVFLLLIAGTVAVIVAESIAQPITQLGERLDALKLGQNEPIDWNSNDEIGELINAYNRMLEKLDESTKLLAQSERESAWREMAKQVAHEIKNPLTPIKLNIQYLQHAYQSDPERAAGLIKPLTGQIMEQIDTLTDIATAFSNYAKMPEAKNERFDLAELTRSVHELFRLEAGEDVQIQLEVPEQPVLVFADRNQMQRVLNNLYKNAAQAIPAERGARIHTSLEVSHGLATLRIRDNGTGIPEALHDKVFAPNFTTKSSGSGLGLAMARNIVEATGGRIYFTTQPNEGTCFVVEVPVG